MTLAQRLELVEYIESMIESAPIGVTNQRAVIGSRATQMQADPSIGLTRDELRARPASRWGWPGTIVRVPPYAGAITAERHELHELVHELPEDQAAAVLADVRRRLARPATRAGRRSSSGWCRAQTVRKTGQRLTSTTFQAAARESQTAAIKAALGNLDGTVAAAVLVMTGLDADALDDLFRPLDGRRLRWAARTDALGQAESRGRPWAGAGPPARLVPEALS